GHLQRADVPGCDLLERRILRVARIAAVRRPVVVGPRPRTGGGDGEQDHRGNPDRRTHGASLLQRRSPVARGPTRMEPPRRPRAGASSRYNSPVFRLVFPGLVACALLAPAGLVRAAQGPATGLV